jgi:NADH:ubiquinone oxidoreductase subunit 6 (subunit J)
VPYLTAIVGQIAIIFYFFVSVMKGSGDESIDRPRRNPYLAIAVCGAASSLFIAVFPLLLYLDTPGLNALGMLGSGVLTALSVFHVLMVRYQLREHRILRQKMRLLSVGVAVAATLVMQYW